MSECVIKRSPEWYSWHCPKEQGNFVVLTKNSTLSWYRIDARATTLETLQKPREVSSYDMFCIAPRNLEREMDSIVGMLGRVYSFNSSTNEWRRNYSWTTSLPYVNHPVHAIACVNSGKHSSAATDNNYHGVSLNEGNWWKATGNDSFIVDSTDFFNGCVFVGTRCGRIRYAHITGSSLGSWSDLLSTSGSVISMCRDQNYLYCVNDVGNVFRVSINGNSFHIASGPRVPGERRVIRGCCVIHRGFLYVVATDGALMRYSSVEAGDPSALGSIVSTGISSVIGIAANESILLICSGISIHVSRDGGITWTTLENSLINCSAVRWIPIPATQPDW